MSDAMRDIIALLKRRRVGRCTGECCYGFTVSTHKGERYYRTWPTEWLDGATFTRWTCKYFDPQTGNCREYDRRPMMCRNFPWGRAVPIPRLYLWAD